MKMHWITFSYSKTYSVFPTLFRQFWKPTSKIPNLIWSLSKQSLNLSEFYYLNIIKLVQRLKNKQKIQRQFEIGVTIPFTNPNSNIFFHNFFYLFFYKVEVFDWGQNRQKWLYNLYFKLKSKKISNQYRLQ